jgi:hypothetical protein
MVCRVARLAVVAAAADGLDRVDAGTVERIWRDLLPDHGAPAPATVTDDEFPSNARVRSIRRLGD